MKIIRFDEDEGHDHSRRLAREFLNETYPLLRGVTLDLGEYSHRRSGYVLTITCAVRTLDENNKVKGYPYSGHLKRGEFCYALDLRTRDMSDALRDDLCNRLDLSAPMIYWIYHRKHLHVGVPRAYHKAKL
jgi:hypothetical protein